MRKHSTTFYLKTNRSQYEAEVLPWLQREVSYKRGDKKVWHAVAIEKKKYDLRHFVPTKRNPTRPEQEFYFRCEIAFSNHYDAVRFALRFEAILNPIFNFVRYDNRKAVEYILKGDWNAAKPIVKWMNANLPSRSWSLSGSYSGPWVFYITSDEANMTLQLLAPSKALTRR